jgi:hypothetical protein
MKTKVCKCFSLVLVFVLGAVVAILVLASMKPDEFYVTRGAVIHAPPVVVFEKVNNLQNWNSFSPWAKLDPDAKIAFEGPQAGEGAIFRWDGDRNVGAGSMMITESRPTELVKFRLDFLRPFEDTTTTDFIFHPDNAGTYVTWSMYGKNTFFSKILSVVMDCDKMIGDFFEEGLANLDTVSRGS